MHILQCVTDFEDFVDTRCVPSGQSICLCYGLVHFLDEEFGNWHQSTELRLHSPFLGQLRSFQRRR